MNMDSSKEVQTASVYVENVLSKKRYRSAKNDKITSSEMRVVDVQTKDV